jgi:hypothetical protein
MNNLFKKYENSNSHADEGGIPAKATGTPPAVGVTVWLARRKL